MEGKLKEEFNNIIDCFTCADGGALFLQFKFGLEALDKQVKDGREGKEAAAELLLLVERFSNLINVVGKGKY